MSDSLKIKDCYDDLRRVLQGMYGVREAKAIAMRALGIEAIDMLSWVVDLQSAAHNIGDIGTGDNVGTIGTIGQDEYKSVRDRLMRGEPVQYITGVQEFCGHEFRVSPSVLIPRVETEQLVALVVDQCHTKFNGAATTVATATKGELRILDIGTGSGAIAVSLALALPESCVTGWDISVQALAVARENAERLGAAVDFEQHDILNCEYSGQGFDVVVSNPPYITPAQREVMASNVLEHEPHLALFVEQDDPLIFYRAIADFALRFLKEGGMLFFEINEIYADECSDLLIARGFRDICVLKDIYDKDRMICSTR